MVRFTIDAIKASDLTLGHINSRYSGDTRYPPATMLRRLIYCYATGTFSSRRIKTPTHENVATRLLTADSHSDHDFICKLCRET